MVTQSDHSLRANNRHPAGDSPKIKRPPIETAYSPKYRTPGTQERLSVTGAYGQCFGR